MKAAQVRSSTTRTTFLSVLNKMLVALRMGDEGVKHARSNRRDGNVGVMRDVQAGKHRQANRSAPSLESRTPPTARPSFLHAPSPLYWYINIFILTYDLRLFGLTDFLRVLPSDDHLFLPPRSPSPPLSASSSPPLHFYFSCSASASMSTFNGRTLVLCFDGTTNIYDFDNTNIIKFFDLLRKDDPDRQMVYYQPGVR